MKFEICLEFFLLFFFQNVLKMSFILYPDLWYFRVIRNGSIAVHDFVYMNMCFDFDCDTERPLLCCPESSINLYYK